MATIQAAILASQPTTTTEEAAADDETDSGAVASLEELSPRQALYLKEQRARREEARRAAIQLSDEQEAILAAQEKLLGKQEADKLRQEQEREAAKSQALKAAESALKSGQQIVHGADVRIGSIPQPGSIIFPLVMLLICFFILLAVNGNSRLAWLWLVVTGNAYVSDTAQQQPATTQTGQGGGSRQQSVIAAASPTLVAAALAGAQRYSSNGMTGGGPF